MTRHKRQKLPQASEEEKPPQPRGYYFRPDGAGWECRTTYYEGTKRKFRYVAHLSGSQWRMMRRDHPTKDGQRLAVAAWIEEQEKAKI